MTSVSKRVRAADAALRVASRSGQFRVRDVLAECDNDDVKRRTAARALRDLEELGRVEQRTEGSPIWISNVTVNLSGVEGRGDLRILHVFADRGVEAEVLTAYGEVVRIGWEARDTNQSQPVRADARHLPIQPGVEFDLVVLHPPCTRWSDMTSISGDPEEHPNLIPLAREIGEQYGAEYIIENKPKAPLNDPVRLDARMFGIPLAYERAFETSFEVDDPPKKRSDVENECSPYFYSDRSREWWASTKGYSGPYTKTALAKNAVPAACMRWLMQQYLAATNHADRDGQPVEGHGSSSNAPGEQARLADGGMSEKADQ